MAMRATWGLGLISAALLLMAAAPDKKAEKPAMKQKASPEVIKRGEYMVNTGGCHDCHTPMKMGHTGPEPDMTRALSGHPEGAADPEGTLGPKDLAITGTDFTVWKQPFGTVYARNLTPDKTGLGEWTEQQFMSAMRAGRHQGDGRALLPPMPWFNVARMTDEDLKSVFAYLQSLKPIKNTVPDPKVPPQVQEQFLKNNAALSKAVRASPNAQ